MDVLPVRGVLIVEMPKRIWVFSNIPANLLNPENLPGMKRRNVMMRKVFYSSLVAFFMLSAVELYAAVQYDYGGGVENVKTKQFKV